MTERTKQLKKAVIYKGYVARKEAGKVTRREFRKQVKICLERARLITKSYQETEGEPEVIRRAKALAKILGEMTIYVEDNQLLVGNFASNPASLNLFPELATRWLDDIIDNEYKDMLSEDDKKELKEEIFPYWDERSIDGRVSSIMPEHLKPYVDFAGNMGLCYMNHWRDAISNATPNYDKTLGLGLKKIISQVEEKLSSLKLDTNLHPKEHLKRRYFLEAALIALRAAVNFAERYAIKARELAKSEPEEKRRAELEEIANICDWVPANHPRTFREAVQFYWFVYLINRLIETHGQGEGTRLDQLLYPYYEKDKEAGRITREEAQEIIECLWAKVEGIGHLCTREMHVGGAGVSIYQTYTVGGVNENGDDATNEVSFIILDACKNLNTLHTDIALRYHSKISHEFIIKAIDVVHSGGGYPKFFNDSAIIQFIMGRGIPLKTARKYGIGGCVGWIIPGVNAKPGRASSGAINLGKCLEMALNQGVDPLKGNKLGVPTPDPKTFTSTDDVMDSYLKQVRYVTEKLAKIENLAQDFYVNYMQCPFTSALMDGCIETGKDYHEQSDHSWTALLCCGNTNVADSLAAIQKFVFDNKAITMEELMQVLENNFEGQEDLRLRLLNEAPKFGNDDDYVDKWMREVQHRTNEVVNENLDYYGKPWTLDGSIAGGYYPWGRRTGALPDGKKYTETFADAVFSPVAGRDKKGPTAVLMSMGKVTPTWPFLANQKFLPQFLEGDNRELFAKYLKTWSELGNWHIQFNVVSRKTLLDAQANPQNYSDLIVRVAGYSAYFVDLTKGLQDDIIARVEQSLNS